VTWLTLALTVLLLLETVPSAVAQLTEGRNLRVVTFLGAANVVGSAAVIAGIFAPAIGIAGAALEAGIFSWVVSQQHRHGDRGKALGAYLTFTGMALAVLAVDAIRLA
jgi:hypothetical protein